MSINVKATLLGRKTRADGTAPIYLRFSANGRSSYKATGIAVRPADWNAQRQQVRASCDLATAYNARIKDLLHAAVAASLAAPTARAVKSTLEGAGAAGSATDYFAAHVARLEQGGRYWQAKHFGVTLNHLRAALGANVLWAELDRKAVERFEAWLRDEAKNKPNTVRNHLKRLRRVIKEAVKEGGLPPASDPFLTYTPPAGAKVRRRKLTADEIRALADVQLADGTTEALARDVFLFALYGAGVRASDVAALRAKDVRDGRMTYTMMKTGTPVAVTLPEAGRAIAERYAATAKSRGGLLFPLIAPADARDPNRLRKAANRANSRINGALKRLAPKAGLDPEGLTMHIARHSFADLARRKGGNLHDVSKALGHSSLAVTQGYLASLDVDAPDRLAALMWT